MYGQISGVIHISLSDWLYQKCVSLKIQQCFRLNSRPIKCVHRIYMYCSYCDVEQRAIVTLSDIFIIVTLNNRHHKQQINVTCYM